MNTPSDISKPTIKDTDKARQGVTGHGVRYVLAFTLAGVVVSFIVLALTYAS